jgi:predicted permease
MKRTRRLIDLGKDAPAAAPGDMQDEIAFHLEARVAFLVARGWSEDAARAEALRRFSRDLGTTRRQLGGSAQHKERRLALRRWSRDFTGDLQYALRSLGRQPAFTAIAVLTIALGIGANTAIYSAVDAMLWRALPFREPGRLMDVVQTSPDEGDAPWSYPKFAFFRDAQQTFGSLAVHAQSAAILSTGEPERIDIEEVSTEYLTTLGVRVSRGSDFPGELDRAPGAPRVALISDALWQRRFNSDPGVVGQTLQLDNTPWEIAGVLPPGFHGLSGRAQALLNVTARTAQDLSQDWSLEFSLVGRLKGGATPAAASAEARQLGPRIYAAFPMREGSLTTSERPMEWTADARALDSIRVSHALRRSLLVLFGAVGLVLLVACVNLANLLVARGISRHQEIAVRQALGARRGRLIRMLVTEAIAIATLGGIASLAVASAGTRALQSLNPAESLRIQGLEGGIGVVGFSSIALDARALLFTLGITVIVGVIFGIVPALRTTRADPASDLKAGRTTSGSVRLGSSRRTLVVVETALAVVLLAASGLMIRSLARLLQVDPGFDAERVLTLRLSMVPGTFAPDSMPGFSERLQEAVAAVPGVERVALADCPPLNNGCNGTIMTFADRAASATGNAMVGVHWVSPSWFQTLRVPLKRGRSFEPTDRLGGPRVVLINEEAARQYFKGEDPIGKRVAVYQGGFDAGAEVVGIVGDVRYGTIDSTARPDVYISYGQARIARMMLFVRTTGEPELVTSAVRAAIRREAPLAPVYDVRSLADRVDAAGGQARFTALVLGLFAGVALALAVMGIYGVTSYGVAQRSRELGIRMALGAGRSSVTSLILREAVTLAGVGLAIGVVAALVVTRVLRAMLFEVSTTDPATYIGMAVLLGVAALLASWIPARRAARGDPTAALRLG